MYYQLLVNLCTVISCVSKHFTNLYQSVLGLRYLVVIG